MSLHPVIGKIVAHKREEVAALKQSYGSFDNTGRDDRAPRRSLAASLTAERTSHAVIAEVKRASPSAMIRPTGFDPVAIARGYDEGGAAAISVLTDSRFFCGAQSYVPLIRDAVSLPVLRKEFIIDPWQIDETAHLGADALLLMAVCFESSGELQELYGLAVERGIEPLIEIHSEEEWGMVESLKPPLVGINNRDFRSADLAIDLRVTETVAPLLPEGTVKVSESGVSTKEEMDRLSKLVDGFLIGYSLMINESPGDALATLLAGGE